MTTYIIIMVTATYLFISRLMLEAGVPIKAMSIISRSKVFGHLFLDITKQG